MDAWLALDAAIDNAGPAWFTSIMGTGILAISFAVAPVRIGMLHEFSRLLFVLDAGLFAVFLALWVVQIARSRQRLVASFADPVSAQPWGAPPMACFTVAVGFLDVGSAFLAPSVCTLIAQGLWIAGVLLSLLSAFLVPFLMFTSHDVALERSNGSWLLPVVPPIVASVPAALLLRTWPLPFQATSLAIAYALLGIGMALAAILIVVFYTRLLFHKIPEGAMVATMWLVVGPLGQSVAGIVALGAAAHIVWPSLGTMLLGAGVAYGLLTWGFGIFWLALAITATLRAARREIPFTLGWWALTFPVGTLISGSFGLYGITRAPVFALCGMLLVALLTLTWTIVAARSLLHVRRALSSLQPRSRAAPT